VAALLGREKVKVALPLITTGLELSFLNEREKTDQLAIFSGGQHAGLVLIVVSHTSCRRVKAQGTKGTGFFQDSGAPVPWGPGNSVERGQKVKDSLPLGVKE